MKNRTPQQYVKIIRYCNRHGWKLSSLRVANLWDADLRVADLRVANLRGADLREADLRDVNLRYANLRDVNLRDANLRYADLRDADLRYANLRDVNLRDADLREADLREANLRGANLRDADLNNVVMCWTSHDLIAERLRQAAGNDPLKRMTAGYIAMSTDWCWAALIDNAPRITLLDGTTLLDWTLNTMATWVRDGDDAPQILKERAA